jgi:hypothetical protein
VSKQFDSPWVFKCKFGLSQGGCGRYEEDDESRGFGRFIGCASCIHREAASEETEKAEEYWDRDAVLRL